MQVIFSLYCHKIRGQKDVKSIILEDSIDVPVGVESIDISYAQNGKVIAYATQNETGTYDMYIQGHGALYAPVNSSYLFKPKRV